MKIAENIAKLKSEIPEGVKLVAVSKFKSEAEIMEAYEAGHRDFGENRVQELQSKYENLPKDIRWHMIGSIQTNKVKYFTHFAHLIHAIDREKVLKEINKQAKKDEVQPHVLLQLHIAREETKQGLSYEECSLLLDKIEAGTYPDVTVCGFMGMATFTTKEEVIRTEFRELREFAEKMRQKHPNLKLDELSMGMSGDYKIAVEEGSTIIRVGSAIFGER